MNSKKNNGFIMGVCKGCVYEYLCLRSSIRGEIDKCLLYDDKDFEELENNNRLKYW